MTRTILHLSTLILAVLAVVPALAQANAGKPDQVITIEGTRPASEAAVATSALRYFPFDVPEGVTSITIHKDLDWGPEGNPAGTVDHGLFDPRGYAFPGPGFRGWQGGAKADMVLTGDRATTAPWLIGGPIPAGTWTIAQSLLVCPPQGLHYKFTVTLGFNGPRPPAKTPVPVYKPGVMNPKAGWYPGLVHVHTVHSDGANTLPEIMARAKADGFAFLVSTEHNTTATHYEFADDAKAVPGLLLIAGMELTTPSGHANAIGMPLGHWYDFRMDAGDGKLPGIIARAHHDGAMFSVNHPFAGCTSCFWKFPFDEWKTADAIEVWNGAFDGDDRRAVELWDAQLKAGRHVAAMGGSDYHRGNDPFTPAVFVHAEKLSERALVAGMRAGHTFLTESPNGPKLYLSVDGSKALPGETAKVLGAAKATVHVLGGKGLTLRFVWATGEATLPVESSDATLHHPLPANAKYVRAELQRPNNYLAALTNAIYLAE